MRAAYKGTANEWLAQGFELRHLRYFLAAVNRGSMNAAKAEVHVAQSSVSRAIDELESALGVRLVHRLGSGGVSLTPAGKRFARDAESALLKFDQAFTRAASGTRPQFHLGYAPSPTVEILPRVLPAIRACFPQHQVIPCIRSVKDSVDQIRRRELHCALTVRPLKVTDSGIRFLPLVNYDLQCAVHPRHPFAREPHLPVKRLESESLLVFKASENPQYFKDLQRLFAPHGVTLKPGLEYEEPEDILGAVAANYGVALLLECARALGSPKIVWLPLRPAVQTVEVGVIYKHPPKPLMREVLATFQQATEPLRTTGDDRVGRTF